MADQYYVDLAQRLDAANQREKTKIIDSACVFLAKSKMKIYRELKKGGWTSCRKKRSDAGTSEITQKELLTIASLMRSSELANEKSLMSAKLAIEIAFNSGQIKSQYHEANVLRLMAERNCHPKALKKAKPHVSLKTDHPNQLWQCDPSICVLYYLKKDAGMAVMDKDEFYKNKMNNLYKIANERVFRYVVTDHASGAFYCKYYLARGENQEILFDFLMTAMGTKDKQKNPFEGVPKIMYWDRGSANTSHLIKNLMNQLRITHKAHQTGNSRAKGQVEKTNDIIERNFEGRLFLMKIQNIEELNYYCEHWQRNFQWNTKHTRHNMSRFDAWRRIKECQLITRPPIDVCKKLLTTKAEKREVNGNYQISYDGKKYNVGEIDNVSINSKISVRINPYSYPNIMIDYENRFGKMIGYDIAPLEKDAFGFTSDAIAIDGHDHQAKLSPVDKSRQLVDEMAFDTKDELEIKKIRQEKTKIAFDGKMDAMGYLEQQNQANDELRIQRKGKRLDVGEPALQKLDDNANKPGFESVTRDDPKIKIIEFIKWLSANDYEITPDINNKIRSTYKNGLRESDYKAVAREIFAIKKQELRVI